MRRFVELRRHGYRQPMREVPVIDLFSGPGGLSEGFARYHQRDWNRTLSPVVQGTWPMTPACRFGIRLSIEKDEQAHQTLTLRAFCRQFDGFPPGYADLLRGTISASELMARYPVEAAAAREEAWHGELGEQPTLNTRQDVDARVRRALGKEADRPWVLIGGPPCQAYSLVGRARRAGMAGYVPEQDERHFLYRDYLRIVAKFAPAVFVMENVKGVFSAKVGGAPIFERMQQDLERPFRVSPEPVADRHEYRLYSFVESESLYVNGTGADFLIRSEQHGVPQTRHRVIILGVRKDIRLEKLLHLPRRETVPLRRVIGDLPEIRSEVSRRGSTDLTWEDAVGAATKAQWLAKVPPEVKRTMIEAAHAARRLRSSKSDPRCTTRLAAPLAAWYDPQGFRVVANHESRGHMPSDLQRYLFAASFAKVEGRPPVLLDFPRAILPDHANATCEDGEPPIFNDRFRVQVADRPATTVTSHIAKDGHYFIHYDPSQCRAFTVREAARVQTFPDDYMFCGNRTAQFHQVGNAVPPMLAVQLAHVVATILFPHGPAEQGKTKLEHGTDQGKGHSPGAGRQISAASHGVSVPPARQRAARKA